MLSNFHVHLLQCLEKGPQPLQKRVRHKVRSSASSFSLQYLLSSLRSASSCLCLLLFLLIPSVLLSVTCLKKTDCIGHILLSNRRSHVSPLFLISNFRRVLNVVFYLLSDSPLSEFYMPTFRNTLSLPSSHTLHTVYTARQMEQSVPKSRHIKVRRQVIAQKKECKLLIVQETTPSTLFTSSWLPRAVYIAPDVSPQFVRLNMK